MIDFHSHVLPGIDDGAQNVQMSLEMLRESAGQGVTTVVATPHCYLKREKDISEFLKKRNESHEILKEAMERDGGEFPTLRMGCELQIMKEIPDMNYLKTLCIENTDYILVEMPYTKWNVNCYDFLYAMILRGMKPVMAHIERFWGQRSEFYNLFSLDLIYQVNADAFLSGKAKKWVAELFAEGAVHIIGSDMHNTASRTTRMGEAAKRIVSSYGEERLEYLMTNAERMLENKQPEKISFPKLSFFEKMKL